MGNSPFFQYESPNNPNRIKAISDINASVNPGFKKGKSTSTDASGKKYPLGFTPPVDFYVSQADFEFRTGDDDLGSINPNDTGLFISKRKKGGVDLVTGRHIEYGRSITYRTDDDQIAILGVGNTVKTLGNGAPINYSKNYLGQGGPAFSPRAGYIVPDQYSAQAAEKGLTTSPIEYGNVFLPNYYDNPKFWIQSKIWNRLESKYAVYDNSAHFSRKYFTHILDYFQDDNTNTLENYSLPSTPKYINETIIRAFSDNKAFDLGQFNFVGSPFYLQTSYDNEDPTYFGFNVVLKTDRSPLFNQGVVKGTEGLSEFLTIFGDLDGEINARKIIYEKFRKQIFRFFNTNQPSEDDSKNAKSYYIQNITGLNKLVENFTDVESKQFADFGKDLITLDFVEDVSQNIGYLASLYRFLSYSKMKGKVIIPENLLRFDVDIEVTEIRNMNRQVVDPNDKTRMLIYSDKISRYVYSLYECKLKFEGMPHGDTIKNGDIGTEAETFKINFDYKFSTMKFDKFSGRIRYDEDNRAIIEKFTIDNGEYYKGRLGDKGSDELKSVLTSYQRDTGDYSPVEFQEYKIEQSHANYISDRLNNENRYKGIEPLEPKTLLGRPSQPDELPANRDAPTDPDQNDLSYGEEEGEAQSLADIIKAQRSNERERRSEIANEELRYGGFSKAFDQLKAALANAAIRQANRVIITQAALLNKTIENIRNSVPYAGRMSEPTNVYTGNNAFKNDAINAARDFASNLIRGAFTRR